MIKTGETFFTIVGCMDGRVHGPVIRFGRKKFNAEFADTITEAGLVSYLQTTPYEDIIENFKKKINLSVIRHKSQGIIVFGHQECAGNPVED